MFPINFSIPKEKICGTYNSKTKILSDLIPGDMSTYIYNSEEDYYDEYKQSYFAITKKKAGWDCMRHYEILANGCVPFFIDIEKCPKNTMTFLPKNLLIEANILFNKFNNKNINELTKELIEEYNILRGKLLDHTRNYLTTEKMAGYILQKTGYENKVSKILYLSGRIDPDYLRCLTLHGFKTLFGSDCHDYPKIEHIYKSKDIDYEKLKTGKGMSYSNLLESTFHNEDLDSTLVEDIKNKYYDIIIYGSYHRGTPYYELICSVYKPNEIILLCGEDLHYRELICTIYKPNETKLLYEDYLHYCNYAEYVNKGHFVFVREL